MKIYQTAGEKLQDFEIYSSTSQSQTLAFESDLFKHIETSQSQGIGLRIINNGLIGFSFSNNFDDEHIINRALESSQFGEKAVFSFASNGNSIPKMELYYKDTANFSNQDMIQMGESIVENIKDINSEIKVDVSISKIVYDIKLFTSNGFEKNYTKSIFSVSANGLLAKDDQMLNIYKSKSSLPSFKDIDQICHPIKENFQLCQKSSSIKSGNYKVLFTPKGFKTLISILTSALNGKSVQKGISPLSEKLGDPLLDERISLIDDGTIEQGLSSAPFDGEGTPVQKNVLFDKGILKSFIYDKQTAGLMQTKSTGSASRSYSSIPSPGFRNLKVPAGNDDYNSMLDSIDEGILVDQFIGAGQSNVIAGEFSMNLALAYKIEKGQLSGRLKDVMMSGNVYEVLNQVLALGDQLHQEGSGFYPYILLDQLSISSKY